MASASRDRWAEWLANRRFGGDQETTRRSLSALDAVRDRVLDGAQLAQGEHLVDVGCGDGLIAFGALARGAGAVTFCDISADLLGFCRCAAGERGVLDRCRFVEAPADALDPLESGSADVVTTRSVLIFVADKAAAFAEFARVLRPGGRVSLFEPINRFGAESRNAAERFGGYDVAGLGDIGRKLRDVCMRRTSRSTPTRCSTSTSATSSGSPSGPGSSRSGSRSSWWSSRCRRGRGTASSTAPGTRTSRPCGRRWRRCSPPAERERLVGHLRPLVEHGAGEWRMGSAYLVATKPASAEPSCAAPATASDRMIPPCRAT